MSMPLVVEDLHKTYTKGLRRQPVPALCGVSFQISEGEAFGFIGPNGAGKSSTIRILMGLAMPTRGDVRLFGQAIGNAASRLGVGYVPENPYLYDYLTPTEIVRMSLRQHRVNIDDPDQHCRHWIEKLELGKVAHSPIRSFSKGMTQRVAICQALAICPRFLILDEPLSGLDPIGRHDVVELLADYKRNGGTLFFTSHVLHDVERLADRIGMNLDGRLRSVSTPSELAGDDDRVVVRTQGGTPIDAMVEEAPGRWSAELRRTELWAFLERARQAGHAVIDIRAHLSLERAFLRVIGKHHDSSPAVND